MQLALNQSHLTLLDCTIDWIQIACTQSRPDAAGLCGLLLVMSLEVPMRETRSAFSQLYLLETTVTACSKEFYSAFSQLGCCVLDQE